MSIWVDTQIRDWASSGLLDYDDKCVNPASYDLHLGQFIRVPAWYWCNPLTRSISYACKRLGATVPTWSKPIDISKSGFDLWPNQFILAHSAEVTTVPPNTVCLLFSKSSIGRIGLEHLHAGYGDPGFSGQWTFELHNVSPWPIHLSHLQRVMQIVFINTVSVPENLYGKTGRYQYQLGPTPSR